MSADVVVNTSVLVSLMFWGAWGIFDKKALSLTTPTNQLFAVYAFAPLYGLLIAGGLTLTMPSWHLSPAVMLYCSLGAAASVTALGAYLLAMSKGDASVVLGVTAGYPVVAQILAHFILGEPLLPARLLGCSVMVAGIVLLSATAKKNSSETGEVRRGVSPALITTIGITLSVLCWALRGIFDKLAVSAADPFEVCVGKYLCDSILALILFVFLSRKATTNVIAPKAKSWALAGGSALCLAGGNIAYYIALAMASASYVITITGCYPLVMYLLALLVLKERFCFSRAAGIALITIGGILTQTTSTI